MEVSMQVSGGPINAEDKQAVEKTMLEFLEQSKRCMATTDGLCEMIGREPIYRRKTAVFIGDDYRNGCVTVSFVP